MDVALLEPFAEVLGPRVCKPLLTGAGFRQYLEGNREVCGIYHPDSRLLAGRSQYSRQ